MNTQRWATCGDAIDADALRSWLQHQGITESTTYRLKDIEDLDGEIRAGHVNAVLLPDPATLLRAAFDGLIRFDEWQARGIQLRFLREPRADHQTELPHFLLEWIRWEKQQRRRRVIAGFILSIAAMASAAAVMGLASH